MSFLYEINQLGDCNIRVGPSLNYPKTGKIKKGGTFWKSNKMEVDGPRKWYKDNYGWVSSGSNMRYMNVINNKIETIEITPPLDSNNEIEHRNILDDISTPDENKIKKNKDIKLSMNDYKKVSGKFNHYGGFIMDKNELYNLKRNKFIITPYIDLFDKVRGTRELLFFTKPDLNILDNNGYLLDDVKGHPEFIDAYNKNKDILKYLTHKSSGPFIPLLTNTVKNTLDLPDINMETKETVKNMHGTTLLYRTNSELSSEKHKFSLEFEDSKYGEIYTFFDIWDRYSSLTNLGILSPKKTYELNNEIDDQISIFKIILSEDFRHIIKIFEIIGVFPENVPRSSYSELKSGSLIYNISWSGNFIIRSETEAINDFNILVRKNGYKTPNHISNGHYTGDSLIFSKPYILSTEYYGKIIHLLEWSDYYE